MSCIISILSFIWLELCNAFLSSTTESLSFVCAILFASGIAFILHKIINSKWLFFAITEVFTIFFLIEHFTNAAYSVFMNPAAIVLGAGGVATGYMDIVKEIVISGLGKIALMELPAIVILILNIKKPKWYKQNTKAKHANKKQKYSKRLLKIVPGFIILIIAIIVLRISFPADFTYAYNYDNAVRKFGVLPAVSLDLKYGIFGVPNAPQNEPIVEEEEEQEPEGPSIKDLGYKGLFSGKNLIVICAESFTKELIREDINPMMYRMAKNGIQIEDFYQPAWGGSTSTGESSILLGLIPTDGVSTIQKFSDKDNSFTIANKLKKLGYHTYAFHNGDYEYYDRNITHVALGYDQFIACGNGMEVDSSNWPKSDKEMMDFSVNIFKDNDPFCIYYMTISGHCRYTFGGNSMAKKHREYIQSIIPNASERVQAYYACNYDLELGLESLVKQLEDAGKLDDTVIVITGDHYPYAMEKGPTYNNDVNYLEELFGYPTDTIDKRDHNGLIIWSPVLEELEEPVISKGVSYTPDILPTLLNLFGVEYNKDEYVGRDILSNTEGIAIWPNGSWKTSKGFYNASKGTFSGTADKEYIDSHRQIAAGKISKSRELINKK